MPWFFSILNPFFSLKWAYSLVGLLSRTKHSWHIIIVYPMFDVFTLRVMKTGFVIRQIERLITDQPRSSGKDRWKISLPKMSR